MIKSQKSIRNGIEDFLCPFTDMYITQGSGGNFSHKGTMANDIRGSQSGVKYPYYAPCTCKCMRIYPESGQSMWQSIDKVRFANGNIAYATFVTAHDNTFDAKVGQVVKQGQQLGNMGDKAGNGGKAYGVHCHIEIAQNKYTISNWQKNSHGIYCFPNEYDTDACYFMDGTNILNGMGGSWKYLKDVPVEEPKKEEPKPVVDEDKVKITELQKRIDELEYQVENQNAVQTVLEKENAQLKEQLANQPSLIFTSPRTDYYAIKLEANDELYMKRAI